MSQPGYAVGGRSRELARLALTLVQPGFVGLEAPGWLLRRLDDGLGGVGLFGRNIESPEQVARLTAQVHDANPGALVAIDEEGGDVTRLEHRTGSSWPGNLALGRVDDVDLTERVAAEIGALLAAVGVDLDYAPDADVNTNAANPVIGVRSFGSDATLAARHTAAWVRGLQSAGVLACAKHFPGHGDTHVDSHLGLPEAELGDPATNPALEPFRAAVAAGCAAVMSAHIRLRDWPDDRPATLVPGVMTGLLRDQLGFAGLAVSDGLEMAAIAATVGIAEGGVLAVAAGVDALCIGGGLADAETCDAVVVALVDAVTGGRLPEGRLVEAADRVTAAAALHRELRQAAAASVVTSDQGAGLDAARRALEVIGTPANTTRAPVIAQLTATQNFAVGDETPAGVVAAARGRWGEVPVLAIGPRDDPRAALSGAMGHPLWVVTRDAHRHTWMASALAEVLAARPDAVVIDTGWPGWQPADGTALVVTRGASRASGAAVVELLGR